MNKIYLIFGIFVCVTLAYANHIGWTVSDSVASGSWTPQGAHAQPGAHRSGSGYGSGSGFYRYHK